METVAKQVLATRMLAEPDQWTQPNRDKRVEAFIVEICEINHKWSQQSYFEFPDYEWKAVGIIHSAPYDKVANAISVRNNIKIAPFFTLKLSFRRYHLLVTVDG